MSKIPLVRHGGALLRQLAKPRGNDRVADLVGAACPLGGLCPPILPSYFGWAFYKGTSRI